MNRQQEEMDAKVAATCLRAYRARWPADRYPAKPYCYVDCSEYPRAISIVAVRPKSDPIRIRLTEQTCDEVTREQKHLEAEPYPVLYAFLVEQFRWA